MASTTSKDDELREQLLEHFTEGAPSYDAANEYQQALACLQADAILPLIKQYGLLERIDALESIKKRKHTLHAGFGQQVSVGVIDEHIYELTAIKDKENN